MELVVNSFKVEPWVVKAIDKYTRSHHIRKSDFIREAILLHLEDVYDIEAFERTKKDKIFTLEEVKRELGLED